MSVRHGQSRQIQSGPVFLPATSHDNGARPRGDRSASAESRDCAPWLECVQLQQAPGHVGIVRETTPAHRRISAGTRHFPSAGREWRGEIAFSERLKHPPLLKQPKTELKMIDRLAEPFHGRPSASFTCRALRRRQRNGSRHLRRLRRFPQCALDKPFERRSRMRLARTRTFRCAGDASDCSSLEMVPRTLPSIERPAWVAENGCTDRPSSASVP